MSYSEKVAYLKGLAEGVGLDESIKEQRLIKIIIEVLGEISDTLSEVEESSSALGGELDEIGRDMSSIEDIIYGLGDLDGDDDDSFEAKCPACGETIPLGVDEFNAGFVKCPKCGEKLEFDYDDDDDEEGCSCGHHHHHHDIEDSDK